MLGEWWIRKNQKGSNSAPIEILIICQEGQGQKPQNITESLRYYTKKNSISTYFSNRHYRLVSSFVSTQFRKLLHFFIQSLTELMDTYKHRLRYIRKVIILNFISSSINKSHRWTTNHEKWCLVYSNICLNRLHTQWLISCVLKWYVTIWKLSYTRNVPPKCNQSMICWNMINNHSMKRTTVKHTGMLKMQQTHVHTIVVKCVIMKTQTHCSPQFQPLFWEMRLALDPLPLLIPSPLQLLQWHSDFHHEKSFDRCHTTNYMQSLVQA